MEAGAVAREPYQIGRYYRVPCVWAPMWKLMVPLFGPLHEDKEIIGFPEAHWHIDWRFVAGPFMEDLVAGRLSRSAHAVVLSKHNAVGEIQTRRLKCKREMPVFPTHPYGNKAVYWLADLEEAHTDARLKCGMICPHRGLPLAGCPVQDGVVVCPGHGLAWNVETGELVRRLPGKETGIENDKLTDSRP